MEAALLATVPVHAQRRGQQRDFQRGSWAQEGLEGLRRRRRERLAKKERERLENQRGFAPEVSRDVDPDTYVNLSRCRPGYMCIYVGESRRGPRGVAWVDA